jgi:hypothetical protein
MDQCPPCPNCLSPPVLCLRCEASRHGAHAKRSLTFESKRATSYTSHERKEAGFLTWKTKTYFSFVLEM